MSPYIEENDQPSGMKGANRATQDAIIVSFVAILCSYYWVTAIWPMIQRRREIHKEKLITMEKLMRKQQTTEIEALKPEEYEFVEDKESPQHASFKSATAKFNLKSTIKKNPEDNISEDDINREVLFEMKGKYVLDESESSSSATGHELHAKIDKNVKEGFVSALHSGDVITVESSEVEYHEKAKSSASKANRNVLHNKEIKAIQKGANSVESSHIEGSAEGEPTTKITGTLEPATKNTTDHRVLWSHISRTTSNISYNTYSDTDSNPWSQPSSAAAMSNPEGLPQDGALTYSEARELRIQQDAEYSLSLAAARKEQSDLQKLADIEAMRKSEKDKRMLRRRAIVAALDEEPEEDVEGVVMLSFRFQILRNSDSDVTTSSTHTPLDGTDGPGSKGEKSLTVNRRFSSYHKISLLFDFIECHDLCPLEYLSLELLLFHPKRSLTRESVSGILGDHGINIDTVLWVKIEIE